MDIGDGSSDVRGRAEGEIAIAWGAITAGGVELRDVRRDMAVQVATDLYAKSVIPAVRTAASATQDVRKTRCTCISADFDMPYGLLSPNGQWRNFKLVTRYFLYEIF